MVRQWQELFYNNRLSSADARLFPRRRKAGRRLRLQGPHDREAARAGRRAGSRLRRARPLSAQREGVAVGERLSDGARRRRDQRNGAGPAATGGRASKRSWFSRCRAKMLQVISLLLENKPGALLRVTGLLGARGYNIESLTVARTLDPALSRMTIVVDVDPKLCAAGDQADEQADQRAAGDRSHRSAIGEPRDGAAARPRPAGGPHRGPERKPRSSARA